MTCPLRTAANTVALTTPAGASDLPTSSPTGASSGPVSIPDALPLPENGTSGSIIASRCKRMTFRSNESRKAYLRIHRALATYSAGDA